MYKHDYSGHVIWQWAVRIGLIEETEKKLFHSDWKVLEDLYAENYREATNGRQSEGVENE